MIKKLQLYTICIVIIVIVLNQFTLLNDSEKTSEDVGQSQEETYDTGSDGKKGIVDEIKNSKYAQPLNDVKYMIDEADRSANKIKGGVDTLKGFMDIEKSLDEITKMMD